MPQIEVNKEQLLRALDKLSPTARRTALAKLIQLANQSARKRKKTA